jgi:hypothetical protein
MELKRAEAESEGLQVFDELTLLLGVEVQTLGGRLAVL